jgi:hypothetical protein
VNSRACQVCSPKIRARDRGIAGLGSFEHRLIEDGPPEFGLPEVGILHGRFEEGCATEPRLDELGASQVRLDELGPLQSAVAEVAIHALAFQSLQIRTKAWLKTAASRSASEKLQAMTRACCITAFFKPALRKSH